MVNKILMIKVTKIINFITAGLILIDTITRFIDFKTATDPFFFFLTFYLIGFTALLVIAELNIRRILIYIEFLNGRIGKGSYILFLGLLIYNEERKAD